MTDQFLSLQDGIFLLCVGLSLGTVFGGILTVATSTRSRK